MSPAPHISFVLPCFNEGSRIASSLATLESWFGPDAEIHVIDDGSVDDTFDRAQRYARTHPRIRVHRLPSHRGKGGAVRAAMSQVRTDLVVFMDADLAYDRQSVQRAIEGLADADVVVGNRRREGSRYSVPVELFGFLYRRHLAGLLFNAFVRAVVRVRLQDTQCGLKGFRRACLERIAPALSVEGFALDVEILVVAEALGARLAEIPVNVRYESAKSSVRLLMSGWAMASDIFRIALKRARGAYAPERLQAPAAIAVPASRPHVEPRDGEE